MKIDLQKKLHPILHHFVVFGEIRFTKKGRENHVFGALSFDVGIGQLCFAGIRDWYSPYVYVMHVCN